MNPDPLLLSAVNHFSYCPRRFAWIHLEGTYAENVHTTKGVLGHARVDAGGMEMEEGVQMLRAVSLWSDAWGIVGKADVVEILADGTPRPVEYKSGEAEVHENDDLQVAAQAVCLEEMMGRPVPEARIYHIASRRRRTVLVDSALRERLRLALTAMRALRDEHRIPPAVYTPRCRGCSLYETCLPESTTLPNEWLFRPLPEPR